ELSMSRFFEEAAEIEKPGAADGHADGPETEGTEREQLLADFAQLSDDSRREVREFIAFKRQQAERLERLESSEVAGDVEPRRPKWPSVSEISEVSEPREAVAAPEDHDKNEDGEVS